VYQSGSVGVVLDRHGSFVRHLHPEVLRVVVGPARSRKLYHADVVTPSSQFVTSFMPPALRRTWHAPSNRIITRASPDFHLWRHYFLMWRQSKPNDTISTDVS
jgi:hypothetical protein